MKFSEAVTLSEVGVCICATCGKRYLVEDLAMDDIFDCSKCTKALEEKIRQSTN